MGRKLALLWHASFSILAGIGFYFAVLPRTPELMGQISHGLGTTARIGCGILIGLTALPVVFTLLRTRKPESGTPKPALTLQTGSIVAHVLAAVLIVGTAVSEIWLRLDAAGQWLFGVYAAAAAIAVLGAFAFYLSFVAELPPRPPKPRKDKQRRGKAKEGADTEAEAAAAAETEGDQVDAVGETEEAEAGAAETAGSEPTASEAPEAPGASEVPETDDLPTAEDTVAAEAPRGGLRNRRPSGKSGGSRRRRRSRGGVALDD